MSLPYDIVSLIIEYKFGINYWKKYFTNKVLPKIDMKWKLVSESIFDNEPCLNCYIFGNGIDRGCLTCQYALNDTEENHIYMNIWITKNMVYDFNYWRSKYNFVLYCLKKHILIKNSK